MARLAVFDKLNSLEKKTDRNVIPIEQFFREMELPREEIENRTHLAYALYPVFTYLFFVASSMVAEGYVDYVYLYELVQRRYTDALKGYNESLVEDEKIKERISFISQEIVNTTIDRYGDAFYTSTDRATSIAENETNSIADYEEFSEAIKNGCTMKRWVSMRDSHVRRDHADVDGTEIPINDYFLVGDDEMMYPCDLNASPEQTINCRCVCEYF